MTLIWLCFRIEKDSTDVNKSSQEVAQKILELQKKFEKAREQVGNIFETID